MTLDSHLMREAKKRAIDLGIPLYQFVEDSLREALVHQSKTSAVAPETGGAKVLEQDVEGRQS